MAIDLFFNLRLNVKEFRKLKYLSNYKMGNGSNDGWLRGIFKIATWNYIKINYIRNYEIVKYNV